MGRGGEGRRAREWARAAADTGDVGGESFFSFLLEREAGRAFGVGRASRCVRGHIASAVGLGSRVRRKRRAPFVAFFAHVTGETILPA